MAAAEECTETLKYQTLILKVSIHCEGCKKKVKKVLQSMEGVYKTTVDPQQHRVVVTGNVAAEILIKKLLKAGKHAELLPQKKPNEGGSGGSSGGSGGNGKKNKNKNNKPNEPSENLDNSQISTGNNSSTVVSDKPDSGTSKNGTKEPSLPPEKEDEGDKAAATVDGGKKKGKKGQKENNNNNNNKNEGASGCGSATEVEVAPQEASKKAGPGGGVVIPPAFNFPVYTTSQVPSYLLSYNSMQPSMSYGGAYYTALPMLQSSYIYSTTSAAPCSCYTVNDENANVCSIM